MLCLFAMGKHEWQLPVPKRKQSFPSITWDFLKNVSPYHHDLKIHHLHVFPSWEVDELTRPILHWLFIWKNISNEVGFKNLNSKYSSSELCLLQFRVRGKIKWKTSNKKNEEQLKARLPTIEHDI